MPEVKYNGGYNNDHNKRCVDFSEIAQLILASQDVRIRKDVHKRKLYDDEIRSKCSEYLRDRLRTVEGMYNDSRSRKRVHDIIDGFIAQIAQLLSCVMIENGDDKELVDLGKDELNYDVVQGNGAEIRDIVTESVFEDMKGADTQGIMTEVERRMSEHSPNEIVIMPKDTKTLLVFQKFGIK